MRFLIAAAFFCCVLLPRPAEATTEFARRAMLSCNACHTVGAALNEFGMGFKLNGYRIPRMTGPGDPPASIVAQGVYSSEPDPTGLPKAILDEVDVLSAGPLTKRLNYGLEVYSLDGGVIGSTREAWLEYQSDQRERIPIQVRAGLQVLPIPVDPERFRETNAHYALYDQSAGNNPFTFFDTHMAVRVGFGNEARGLHAALVASQPNGTMLALQNSTPHTVAEIYRYNGTQSVFGSPDRFSRTGYAFSYYDRRFALNAAVQTGVDGNASGDGTGESTSGGFLQARMQLGQNAFAIARYDGVNDSAGGFGRSLTVGAGLFFFHAFRLEVEDQIFHAPQTHNGLAIVLRTGASTVHQGGFAY